MAYDAAHKRVVGRMKINIAVKKPITSKEFRREEKKPVTATAGMVSGGHGKM